MKKLLTNLTIALCMIVGPSAAMAARNDVTVYFENEEPDLYEESPVGPRMPSRHVICTIYFTNDRMEVFIPESIISYEIWDEDGESVIKSYVSDSDMVAYLKTVSGNFRLRLVTEESAYIGYIEL